MFCYVWLDFFEKNLVIAVPLYLSWVWLDLCWTPYWTPDFQREIVTFSPLFTGNKKFNLPSETAFVELVDNLAIGILKNMQPLKPEVAGNKSPF